MTEQGTRLPGQWTALLKACGQDVERGEFVQHWRGSPVAKELVLHSEDLRSLLKLNLSLSQITVVMAERPWLAVCDN